MPAPRPSTLARRGPSRDLPPPEGPEPPRSITPGLALLIFLACLLAANLAWALFRAEASARDHLVPGAPERPAVQSVERWDRSAGGDDLSSGWPA